jgi:hypothetical protein
MLHIGIDVFELSAVEIGCPTFGDNVVVWKRRSQNVYFSVLYKIDIYPRSGKYYMVCHKAGF